jgi:hypothetical protein
MLSLRFNTVTDEGQVYASTKMRKDQFFCRTARRASKNADLNIVPRFFGG